MEDVWLDIIYLILVIGTIVAVIYDSFKIIDVDNSIDYTKIDKEICRLVRLLNCIPYLYTTCSCCGYDKEPIRIWFNIPAKKVNFVMYYFFNNLNFKDWIICVETTDPNLKSKEINFYLESKRMVSEMKDEINALCDNILCIMLENGFKPKE